MTGLAGPKEEQLAVFIQISRAERVCLHEGQVSRARLIRRCVILIMHLTYCQTDRLSMEEDSQHQLLLIRIGTLF